MMRALSLRAAPLLAVLSALAWTSCGSSSNSGINAQPGSVASVTVHIPPNAMTLGTSAFGTNPLAVQPGTTVTWINDDSIDHTVTSDDGAFPSSTGHILPGQTYSFTFSASGTFPYHCSIHPTMRGTIQVGSGPSPSPSPSVTPAPTPSCVDLDNDGDCRGGVDTDGDGR